MTDFGRVVQDAFLKQRLDQSRGLHQLMKDQMMTGDVPTTVDGPASGRKRKKKGPGDCGPNTRTAVNAWLEKHPNWRA